MVTDTEATHSVIGRLVNQAHTSPSEGVTKSLARSSGLPFATMAAETGGDSPIFRRGVLGPAPACSDQQDAAQRVLSLSSARGLPSFTEPIEAVP